VRTEPVRPVDLRAAWDEESAAWIRWARTPGHDGYWRFGRAAFFELLPPPGRLTLDAGCGEGRVSRDLAVLGHRVISLDASRKMVRAAMDAAPEIPALVGNAAAIPLSAGACDLVVAYMSLQDMEDLEPAVQEMARVLEPGGRLCAGVVHPINSAGRFDSREPDARFVIEGSYLEAHPYVDEVARDGLQMKFSSLHRPMATYFAALEGAGLLVESVREVPVDAASAAADPARHRWRRLPLFMYMRAVKA